MKNLITILILTLTVSAYAENKAPAPTQQLTAEQADRRAELTKQIMLRSQSEARRLANSELQAISYDSIVYQQSVERVTRYVAAASVSIAVLALVVFFYARTRYVTAKDRTRKIEAAVEESYLLAEQKKKTAGVTKAEAEKIALEHFAKLTKTPEFRVRGKVEAREKLHARCAKGR